MYYNFRFLTDEQYKEAVKSRQHSHHHWFCLHEILRMPQIDDADDVLLEIVQPELNKRGLSENKFGRKTLLKLYQVMRNRKIIHYFKETSQKIDHVLDVFIRTNSGGTKLDFSDLLMSIAVANWDGDFRKELDDLIRLIHLSNDMGFYLGRDWVLKTCLMLTDSDVRFKVKNFKSEQVEAIQNQWQGITNCIKASFILIRRFGIIPQSLTSKNAVIPICYYLYKKHVDGKPLYDIINNLAKHHEERAAISRWFYMVLLKGVFGGQADTILSSMRDVLRQNIDEPIFPLPQIIERYKATNKDLQFDSDYVESLLDTQYGEGRCRALLHLLFPEMNPAEVLHIDHLHPKSSFEEKKLKQFDFLENNPELLAFFSDPKHWNSAANLHLLNDSQNRSKNNRSLEEWLEDPAVNLSPKELLVGEISLDLKSFSEFYSTRREALKRRLVNRVYMTNSLSEGVRSDSDEEVIEDITR